MRYLASDKVTRVLKEVHQKYLLSTKGLLGSLSSWSTWVINDLCWRLMLLLLSASFAQRFQPCRSTITESMLMQLNCNLPTTWPFHTWPINLIGHMNTSPHGHSSILTASKYYTSWVETTDLKQASGLLLRISFEITSSTVFTFINVYPLTMTLFLLTCLCKDCLMIIKLII